ncbi:N-acetyltransferase [Patescibacteria group bacterium]|nr:MAG: N-acetyltransferase [Patescibacteria group bacterium]
MRDFPELVTNKLKLRKILMTDLPSLVKYCNNKKISDQIFNIPFPYTEEDAIYRLNFASQGFKNKERYIFAITLKENDELIGEIGLHLDKVNNHAQFGYWVAELFWGKGIATEATSAILKFGFEELQLHKIYATHYPENEASGKVMFNNQMIKEGELSDHYLIEGVYRTVIQYRLTRLEYAAQNASKLY